MRGLAFPSNAVFDREASYDRDYATPRSNNPEAIPIDPALSGTAIDPAITAKGSGAAEVQAESPVYFQHPNSPLHRQHSHEPRQYSQGPQGDPFAPQPAPYLPTVEEVQPSPKPAKRKRRPKREEECGFCQGNDSKNKDGELEPMVSCEECGRSGHPSCMELGEVSEVVRSYPWKCIECKICEICQEKGDDNRILFCDFCDRGWHMDCLQPALEESPPGRWHCPLCPPLVLGPEGMEYYPSPDQEMEPIPEDDDQEQADPSSSRPHTYNKRKGKQKAVLTDDDSDVDMEEDDSDDDIPVMVKGRRRKKLNKKGKARQDSDEEPASPAPPKRPRLRVASPAAPRPRMVVRLRLPTKGKGKEREDDDGPQKGLFEDILGAEDRDTTKSTVEFGDKQRFEKSRLAAEEKLAPPPPPPPVLDVLDTVIASSLHRPLRSSTLHHVTIPSSMPTPGMSMSPAPSTPGSFVPAAPHSLRIRTIRFGDFDIQTWFDAPFPEEYATIPDGRLWICEFCLKYMKSQFGTGRHRMKCKSRHPPGDEIYRDGAISVFEVDGRKNKIYCQNLCLLSKMFLDHKSLFYDVEPFLFYVMTEVDDSGARFVGYFSKEKRSPKDYNVSCIMTLPVRQRQGWGNLLIDFSYLLSKKEQRVGSPEKPLSGLGALGYKNYWTLALMRYLDSSPENPRLEDISAATSMTIEDIYNTLSQQHMVSSREVTPPLVRPSPGQSIKFPKGRKHGIARRHLQRTQTNDGAETTPQTPFSPPTHYQIRWDRDRVTQYLTTWEAKGYLRLKPEKLKWSPFLLARTKKTDGLQTLTSNSSETVDRITIDNPPAPSDGPTTPQNLTRHASVSIFDDKAVASSSRDPLNSNHQSYEQEQSNDTDLPVLQPPDQRSKTENGRSTSHEMHAIDVPPPVDVPPVDIPPVKRPRGRPKGPLKRNTNGMSVVGYRTRSDSARASEMEQSVADDEALATKLALEERRSTRSLRSRPEKTPDLRRTVSSTSATTSSVSRKRRRVESSPESEGGRLPTTNGTGHNGATSTPRHQRKTSRLLNGSGQDNLYQPVPLSSRMNIVPQPAFPPNTKTIITDDNDAFGNPDPDDVKSEAATTPVASWTNRQSVPSDDTVIVADTVDAKHIDGADTTIQASEPLDHINYVEQGNAKMLDDLDAGADADADADVDADGDEDPDAEGEIDAEGELDVEVTF